MTSIKVEIHPSNMNTILQESIFASLNCKERNLNVISEKEVTDNYKTASENDLKKDEPIRNESKLQHFLINHVLLDKVKSTKTTENKLKDINNTVQSKVQECIFGSLNCKEGEKDITDNYENNSENAMKKDKPVENKSELQQLSTNQALFNRVTKTTKKKNVNDINTVLSKLQQRAFASLNCKEREKKTADNYENISENDLKKIEPIRNESELQNLSTNHVLLNKVKSTKTTKKKKLKDINKTVQSKLQECSFTSLNCKESMKEMADGENVLKKDEPVRNESELQHLSTNQTLFNKAKCVKTVKNKKVKDINDTVQLNIVKCQKESLTDNVASNSDSETLISEDAQNLFLACHLSRKDFKTTQSNNDYECGKLNADNSIKTLKCKYCSLTFTQKNRWMKHMDYHKRNNCTFCNAQFTKRKDLCSHLKTEHSIVAPKILYNCTFCNKHFSKKPYLIEHLKSHADGQIVCSKCGFMCKTDSEYTEHTDEHIRQSKYDCHLCGKKFTRRQQLYQHMMGHDRHACSKCDITFSTKKLFMKHQRLVHRMHVILPRKFICSVCKKKFLRPQQLHIHMRIHNGEQPLKCSHCENSFRDKRSLSKHMKSLRHLQVVSSQEGKVLDIEKPYQCLDCGSRFYRQHSLFRHIKLLHSAPPTFKCPHCEYSTTCKTNLKRHEECHSDTRRFICEICGLSFRAFATLKEHHAFMHSEDRSFTCDVCGKSFKSKSILQRHHKTHSENRPYKCHCNRDFKRLSHLKRHMSSVHTTSKMKEEPLVSDNSNCDTSINSVNATLAKSLDPLSHKVLSEAFSLLVVPNCNVNKLEASVTNEDVEEFSPRTSKHTQYPNVPSTSLQNLLDKSDADITHIDSKTALPSLISEPSSHTPPPPYLQTNASNSVSLDDPTLNLSPSNFCNFNLTSSPISMGNNDTSTLQDSITPHDILSLSVDSIIRPHSLPNLNFHSQPLTMDAITQFLHCTDPAELQIQSLLLGGDASSPNHMNDLNLEQSASSKNFFGDSDDSLSLSPYTCNVQANYSPEHLFDNARDIDLWDSGEHCNSLKLTSSELVTNDNFSTNLASNTNILGHNMLFNNESLIGCALDSNALNSDLDTLSNLC